MSAYTDNVIRELSAERDAAREGAKTYEQMKDSAYAERNRLVAVLSKAYPSHLVLHHDPPHIHDGDGTVEGCPGCFTPWDDDWRTIVCVHTPAGQARWHVRDSELPLFGHLRGNEDAFPCAPDDWDGHTTDEKYDRLERLPRAWLCETRGS